MPEGLSSARRALIVLGMHRSGTSALTRVLGLCGATLPRHNMAAGDGNPLGHWEPQPIVDAHDAFLAEAKTGWDSSAGFPDALFDSQSADACRHTLTDLARGEYGDAALFILKDPRISRLMPLWRPVLAELGATPHIVIVVRNPLEIAGSLNRRNGWSERRALIVWLRYMLAAERDTRDLARCFIGYNQLMTDWRGLVAKISRDLDIAFPARGPAVEQEIDGFVRQDLRHHRQQADTLFQRDDIGTGIKLAYRCLIDAVATGAVDSAALDSISRSLDDADAAFERIWLRASRPAVLHETDTEAAPPEANDLLTALMLAEIERANDIAERSQAMVREMRATRSWRYTKPLRALHRAVASRLSGQG
jgi:hypothetical protein